MKNTAKYLILMFIAQMLWSSCENETSQLPEREISPEVEVIAQDYIEELKSAENGWILKYKPENYEDTVHIHLKFQDETFGNLSSYRGYHSEQTELTYYFEGKFTPVIVFSEESVFGELERLFNGSRKFKINFLKGEKVFLLVRSDGYNDKEFIMEEANSANLGELDAGIGDILDQIAFEKEQERLSEETRLKLISFAEIESDFYFYNVQTEDFSASIDQLDTLAKTIALTYKESSTSSPTAVTVNYSLYPKGIVFNPVISYGGVVVDTLELGELKDESIEIVKAGNAGTGVMGYMHEAPYSYTLTTDRTIGIGDWIMTKSTENIGLFAYTQTTDSYFSDLTNDRRAIFGDYLEANGTNVKASTRMTQQLYFSQTNADRMDLSTHKQSGSGNLFFGYRYNVDKIGNNSSQVHFDFYEAYGATLPLQAGFDDYFSYVFPEEGVTVVPVIVGTTLRFRLVSLKDSRYWVEYILNSAADRTTLRFD